MLNIIWITALLVVAIVSLGHFFWNAGGVQGVLLALLLIGLLGIIPWLGLIALALYVLMGLAQALEYYATADGVKH